MIINVKKDRIEINKIIINCLPLMEMNKTLTQECTDAIMLYLIEKGKNKKLEPREDEVNVFLEKNEKENKKEE